MGGIGGNSNSTRFPVLVIGDAGGAHVRTRALAMARIGYEIHILTPRPSGVPELNEILPAEGSDYGRLLASAPGDIAHVHYASSLGAWAFVASGDCRPLVVSVMGGDILFDEQGDPSPAARWLVRQVLLRADHVTASSAELAERVVALGVPKDRIQIVVWGVDTNTFRPVEPSAQMPDLGLAEAAPVIFSPRMLKPFYRTDIIFGAMKRVLEAHPDARLVVSEYEADADFKRRLVALARDEGIDHAIVFAGDITHDRMADYFNRADVTVGIPPSDGFPISVLESMACGTPNVIARLSCYEDILTDRESALFVEPTIDGVGEGILDLLADRELSDRLRRNGLWVVRERAELGRDAARVSEVYQRLRSGSPGKRRSFPFRWAASALLFGLAIRGLAASVFGPRHFPRTPLPVAPAMTCPSVLRP